MLPPASFDRYTPAIDKYASISVALRLKDLMPLQPVTPRLSILISTWNRRGQLLRSLECYARQTFKDFEILINDDGSTEDIKSACDMFSPYLNITYHKAARSKWRSCGSHFYVKVLPEIESDFVAITHPEIMLYPNALQVTVDALDGEHTESYYEIRSNNTLLEGDKREELTDQGTFRWVSLKPQFIPEPSYDAVNDVDWHQNMDSIRTVNGFDTFTGFAGRANHWHAEKKSYPWWFFGAAAKKAYVWEDMPSCRGHAILDMWLLTYRGTNKYIEIYPKTPLCFHQPHLTTAVAPEGEQNNVALQPRIRTRI